MHTNEGIGCAKERMGTSWLGIVHDDDEMTSSRGIRVATTQNTNIYFDEVVERKVAKGTCA